MVAIRQSLIRILSTLVTVTSLASMGLAGPLDEMSLERWAKLREAERFQLNVAERFYREHQYKVAADEYEKFLKLYEKSEGASYAQLKWSHCQVQLRKQNAAIKDGFQSVLDYYPDSPEAPIAAFLIGQTYRDMGDLKPAKKAYAKTISSYPKHFAAVMARFDLAEIATKENDSATQMTLLRELTYDVERKGPTEGPCIKAAWELTHALFRTGNFEEGLKALATTCTEANLPANLMASHIGGLGKIIHTLTGSMDAAEKARGEKLADQGAGWLKTQATAALANEKTKPQAISIWLYVAEVRRQARQPDREKAVYEEMLAALGPDDDIFKRLGEWYRVAKKHELARATYGKLKDATEGQRLIADSFIEEKQYDKAVELYRRLAGQDTKTAGKWLSQAAMTYRQGGKPDQAIAVYRELLTTDAANAAEYHFQIAETLWVANRWKECITAYRGTDRFPLSYFRMAIAHRQLKQYDEAIQLYQQILATSPPNAAAALLEIGYTHEQAGRTEPAIKVFKQVCDRFPKTGEGSQAHAHLNDKYKIPVTLGGAKD